MILEDILDAGADAAKLLIRASDDAVSNGHPNDVEYLERAYNSAIAATILNTYSPKSTLLKSTGLQLSSRDGMFQYTVPRDSSLEILQRRKETMTQCKSWRHRAPNDLNSVGHSISQTLKRSVRRLKEELEVNEALLSEQPVIEDHRDADESGVDDVEGKSEQDEEAGSGEATDDNDVDDDDDDELNGRFTERELAILYEGGDIDDCSDDDDKFFGITRPPPETEKPHDDVGASPAQFTPHGHRCSGGVSVD